MKEVEILLREKANKFDVEMSLRQISVLHKQVRQMIMLMTQKFRQSLESHGQGTENAKVNKKVNLLHQALLIANWINLFDTSGVNDCFNEKANKLPKQLVQYEFEIEEDLKRIEKMKLSPNQFNLNDYIRS